MRSLYPTSVKKKVLAGFLLVFFAIALSLIIARFGFREMMDTVDQLSEPNEELVALNSLFHEIAAFDQDQREQAIKFPRSPYKAYLNQSNILVNKIDSLRLMEWDSTQHVRLLEIKQIMQKRNRLFLSYLKLKSKIIENQTLTQRLDTLSNILVNERTVFDTSVVTTEKKTITTYTSDSTTDDDGRFRIGKLFSKKKKTEPKTTQIKVHEELSVVVDTLSVARQNKALEEVEQIIIDLENDQRAENNRLFSEELDLIHASSLLINQLLSILHEVEKEELAKIKERNDHAAALVTGSMWRLALLLLVFFIGSTILVYLIWIDISRSNYYKLQLEKAKNEAEELSMIKQRFLANMSHEIRTPLQSIIGFAEQLRANPDIRGDHTAVNAIHTSSEHLLQIVNEVLDYSRISSGSFAFSQETFRIMTLVREVESAVRIQADKKGLRLVLSLSDEIDHCLVGDPFRLRQILYNLLGNAIKFTDHGQVTLSVETSYDEDLVDCTFTISDTGVGIDEANLDRIFNQFEQADARIASRHGGTGLGLSIVKSLVEAQGGTIAVESTPGTGSVFTVRLSYRVASGGRSSDHSATSDTSKIKNASVIVIDDDDMILQLCSLILNKHGIPVVQFNDPSKLLQADPDAQVTHILIDIRMPGMSGTQLCQELRAKYPSKTRFIAVTAHVFPQDQEHLVAAGFDAVVAKPFREGTLLALFDQELNAPHGDQHLDLTTLREMTLGDETLFQSIVIQFIEETEDDVLQLERAISKADGKGIRERVHRLAGRLGQIGIGEVSDALKQIETTIAAGENGDMDTLLPQLQVILNQIETLLAGLRTKYLVHSS
jgi:signal transduction histidine kinase/FixJ family two-component response regulator